MKLEELWEKNIPASDDLVYTFNQRILEAMSSAKITYSIKGGPRKSKLWFDKDCYDLKKLAKESLKKYHRECYASSRKKYHALLDLKRKGFDNEKQEILRNAKDSKTWKTIALYKSTSIIQGEIAIQDWLNFYRKPMTTERNLRICNLHNVISQNDPILDSEITNADIYKEIAGLKSNKACGPNGIPNEVLKTLPDSYILLLKQLYNSVMTTGKYPAIWTNSTIHPIFKNGYKNSPSNYQGIALINNVSKLFTSILRSRLEEWVEGRRVIPENQAGFRKGRSCIDHIFTLTTLIQLSLRKKRGKLYVFFVDLRKAFDTVPHSILWKKLYNLGITIRWKGSFTESIKINSGVLQGEPLSPLLFILFIMDLIKIYNNSDLQSVNFPEFGDIHLLLYADNIAIIGESRMNLQKKIKILKEYLDENLMTLNESKSKIMVFRNGGKPSNKDRWFWNDKPITITSRYTYLGFPLTPTITTTHPANYFKGKALTAINATHPILIKSKAKSINLSIKLFDTIVRAVLMYAAPLWATEHKDLLDSIQDIFIRRSLNLPGYTPGYINRLETGRISLSVTALKLTLKYWLRVLNMSSDRLPRICFNRTRELSNASGTPIGFIKKLTNLLNNNGSPALVSCDDPETLRSVITGLLKTATYQSIQNDLTRMDKSKLYSHYKDIHISFMTEGYLLGDFPFPVVRLLAQVRILSSFLEKTTPRCSAMNPIMKGLRLECINQRLQAALKLDSLLHRTLSSRHVEFTRSRLLPSPEDIDRVVLLLTSILQSACDSSMGGRSNTTRPSKPWWTPELSRIRRLVISLRRYSQKVRCSIRNFFRGLYRACHNRLKAAIRKAKSKSWFNLCKEVSSAYWSDIYRFIARGRGSPRGPPLLKHDNGSLYNPHETCQTLLNHLFLPDTRPHPQRNAISAHSDEPEFKPWEVLRAIHRCGKRKAPGPDGLGSKCLDLGDPSLQFLLAELFAKCLRMGHFPRQWKEGRLILLPKSSNSATIFERCILARLQRLADRHGWFFEDQYKTVLGTVNGLSAEDALASITQLIEERQAHWRKTLVISSDISKAFDTVWRPAIIQNLERLNCSESITCLVKIFLEDRTVSYSAWTATECTSSQLGTPQGSALSPFLWNIVARTIFTLPSIIDSRLIAYADDFTLMTQVRSRLPVSATNTFLERLTSWCTINGLNINPIKTQACLFQWRNVHPNSETGLRVLGQPLNIKKTVTILGVEPADLSPTYARSHLDGASAWGGRALSSEGIRQLRSLHCNFAKRVLRGGPYTPTVSAISITGSPPFDIIVRSRTAFLKEINEGNFESRPGPASLPYPPDRRQLSFSLNIEEITTPIIFTDGSKNEAGVGAAIVPSSEDQQPVLLRLHPDCTAFQAELLAIRWAVRLVKEGPVRSTLVAKIILALNTNQNVNLCWVPGHCGIDGKERADRAAKNAAVLILEPSFSILVKIEAAWPAFIFILKIDTSASWSFLFSQRFDKNLFLSLARNHSRAAALDAWTEVYCRDHSNRHLRRIAHTPDRLLQFLPKVRPGEVTTTLLTGHGHVRANLVLWRPGEDPSCPHCMEEQQTVDHLLFRCPAFMQHRMKTALLLGKTSFDPVSLAGLLGSLQTWNFLTSWFGSAIVSV
ncbi:hypothetical protein LAZ67_6003664 [Cordylochernes scorpioides]|uniref:Reverse transcriptase domain-containing protein n=1 Tax=Cordylochernes scorpioides TaxID=51811 RepID=A0ABY6KKS5_9ARAC|nr:hypothetical protein LAZ67_6003664 [Cordylochernes scorpioides]